ncbi:polysaccharide deacetylase family protein [Bdellovibrionota bacterium FG-1]
MIRAHTTVFTLCVSVFLFSLPSNATPSQKIPCIEHEIDPHTVAAITGEDLKPGEIALTFDDGPNAQFTPPILDILDRYGVRATFFEVGEMADYHPKISKEVVDRGHSVGTHTYSHPSLPHLDPKAAEEEIKKGIHAVGLATGGRNLPFFRFPFLSDNPALDKIVFDMGVAHFLWTDISLTTLLRDEKAPQPRQKGILITHDIHASAVELLPGFLDQMLKKHYTAVVFVTKRL